MAWVVENGRRVPCEVIRTSWSSRARATQVEVYVPASVRSYRTFRALSDGKLYDTGHFHNGPCGEVDPAVHTTRDALPTGFPADGYTPGWVDRREWLSDDVDGPLMSKEHVNVFLVAPSGDALADTLRVDLEVLPHVTLDMGRVSGGDKKQQQQWCQSFSEYNRKKRRAMEKPRRDADDDWLRENEIVSGGKKRRVDVTTSVF